MTRNVKNDLLYTILKKASYVFLLLLWSLFAGG